MGKNDEKVEIEMYMHHDTHKAVLVSDDGDEKKAKWIPKSLIEYEHNPKTKTAHVTMPEWLAKREGLI